MNVELARTIKLHLAGQTSDELRAMLEARDVDRYSDEAFAAARELLDERARGECPEPTPTPPPPEPTPAERAAAADALLRRQIRAIGVYYYCVAAWWVIFAAVFAQLGSDEYAVMAAVFAPWFALLGWSLRRFSPAARLVAMFVSMLQWPAFPIGTMIALYCLDKLTRGDYLFGVRPHPGERVEGSRAT